MSDISYKYDPSTWYSQENPAFPPGARFIKVFRPIRNAMKQTFLFVNEDTVSRIERGDTIINGKKTPVFIVHVETRNAKEQYHALDIKNTYLITEIAQWIEELEREEKAASEAPIT